MHMHSANEAPDAPRKPQGPGAWRPSGLLLRNILSKGISVQLQDAEGAFRQPTKNTGKQTTKENRCNPKIEREARPGLCEQRKNIGKKPMDIIQTIILQGKLQNPREKHL